MFRRRRSASATEFGTFLQRQAAFVAQKTVIDYCRVKAGRQEHTLFADPDFARALRHCRWQVYLGSLADVGALAFTWLRPHAAGREEALIAALQRLHAEALAIAPPPQEEAEAAAQAARAFPGHLAALGLAPEVPVHRMPLLAEAPLFATLPVHADQRVGEAEAIRGALRFHFVSAGQEMERLFDPGALAAALLAGP